MSRKKDSSERVVFAFAGHCHRMRMIRVTESGSVTCKGSFTPPPDTDTDTDPGPAGRDEAERGAPEDAEAAVVAVILEVTVPARTRSFRVLMMAPIRRTTAD